MARSACVLPNTSTLPKHKSRDRRYSHLWIDAYRPCLSRGVGCHRVPIFVRTCACLAPVEVPACPRGVQGRVVRGVESRSADSWPEHIRPPELCLGIISTVIMSVPAGPCLSRQVAPASVRVPCWHALCPLRCQHAYRAWGFGLLRGCTAHTTSKPCKHNIDVITTAICPRRNSRRPIRLYLCCPGIVNTSPSPMVLHLPIMPLAGLP